MEALKELNEELNNPSEAKLLTAAKKKGLKVTKAQVKEIVKSDSTVREVFAKPQAQRGAHATNEEGAIVQADLIDLKEQGEEFKYVLVVTELFTRKTHTAKLKTKTQGEVWAAFDRLLDKFPKAVQKVDTDGGFEFLGEFKEKAEAKGIVVQSKNGDVNSNAVSDAAIQSIKANLFRDMAKKGSEKWSDKIEKAESSYNKTPHETLYGESPEGVEDEDVVKFRLLQDNAEKLKGNAKQLGQRQKAGQECVQERIQTNLQWRGEKDRWDRRRDSSFRRPTVRY